MKLYLFSLSFLFALKAFCQFPGPAGQVTSTAITHDDPSIIAWGDSIIIQRGPEDIAVLNSPEVSYGLPEYALEAVNSNVVSLGDGGIAIYFFAHAIFNGPGFDFAIFENAFSDEFLELAFVEVSSDGLNFHRFPAHCLMQDTTQIATYEASGDATKIHNLAGKYRVNFGTPFDLDDLIGIAGLDLNQIHYVRIIDVIGTINSTYGSQDVNGNIINDPYPTAFASGGFDLDAIALMYQEGINSIKENTIAQLIPSIVEKGREYLFDFEEEIEISLFNEIGQVSSENKAKFIAPNTEGYYFLQFTINGQMVHKRIFVH